MKEKYYIAYGIDTYREQMKQKCPDAEIIGTAMLNGFELEFHGTTTVIPKQDSLTPVLIWKISEADEIRLDVCQGIHNGVYQKTTQEIQIGGKKISGLMYRINDGKISPPKEDYVQRIFRGYVQQGMDVNYLNEAVLKAAPSRIASLEKQEEYKSINLSKNLSISMIQYEEFFIRLTPAFLIRQNENKTAEACAGFLIEIFDSEKSFVPLEIISAAAGYELSENSEKESADFAEEYLEETAEAYRRMLEEE